jgi:type I restriction enzyme S subunit
MTVRHPLADILRDAEVFTDGDWVESKDQDANGDVRLIQLADVGDGVWLNRSKRYMTSVKAAALKCTFLQDGDLLLGRMPDPLGRCCFFPGDTKPCVTVVDVCVIRPNTKKVFPRYLMHAINAPATRTAMQQFVVGTTRPRISRKNIGKLTLALPSLAEQKHIARMLDSAAQLRAKRRETIRQLDSIIRAAFLEMFGDPMTNPKGWDAAPLGHVCVLTNGRAFKPSEWEETGIPIIRIQNLNDTEKPFNYTTKPWPKKFFAGTGDILLSWSGTPGTSFGCFRWLGPNGWVNQHIFRVTPKPIVEGTYFIHAVNARLNEIIAKAHGGVGLKHITKSKLENVAIATPPLDLQTRFASIVESIERQKARRKAHLTELDALFASIQSRAFHGGRLA